MPVLPTLNVRSGRKAVRLVAVMVLLVGAAALVVGRFHARPAVAGHTPADPVTASTVQNGVQVTVLVTADTVQATYRPQRPGFHLYSISLPTDGVDGLGIPTRLEVQGGLRATGSPTSDRPVQSLNLPGLSAPLPVYPDGPVAITLPVTRTGSTSAQVVVSYGACSTSTCLFPVRALVIPIRLG